jgi:hypothetical protein
MSQPENDIPTAAAVVPPQPLARCPCGAKYGPYTCKLPKGHDRFLHADGEVGWAPLQRWRASPRKSEGAR